MRDLKYSDILVKNQELGAKLTGERYRIRVLSNLTTSQCNEVIEYSLRSHGIPADVQTGGFDTIAQDSAQAAGLDAVILFWEIANLAPGFHYRANVLSDDALAALLAKVEGEIDFVLKNLQSVPLVLFNSFSSVPFNHGKLKSDALDRACERLNRRVIQAKPDNVVIVDINKVLAEVSVLKAVDFRFFYSSKALYSVEFYKAYAELVRPAFLAACGLIKKALIFDCDNTLWGGILGEDGPEGIEGSSKTQTGSIFEEAQHVALDLRRQGVLLGICSKNNPSDVDEILQKKDAIAIRNEDLSIKKVNWNDKPSNLREIARELSIGLDSLVMVEDSPYEADMIRQTLPEVTVLQVPEKVQEYPQALRRAQQFFFRASHTAEDTRKTEMYHQQAQREQAKQGFASLDEYLRSLGLEMKVLVGSEAPAARLSQLTQKTNQFNCTTRRYSEAQIKDFLKGGRYRVYAFEAADRFGSYGLTGLAIAAIEENSAAMDTFLMSCRVIGRNLETAFFQFILEDLKRSKVSRISAAYAPTAKNALCADFYDRLGFSVVHQAKGGKEYLLNAADFPAINIDYIKVNHG